MILELSQMMIQSTQEFNERLDHATAEDAKLHQQQLAKAAAEHERVRNGASMECERILLEQELEKRRKEEEQRKELQRLQQERARKEAEARQQEWETKRREEEAARQAAEHQKRLQEADDRVRAQREAEELARRQKMEQDTADRNAREAAVAAAAAKQAEARTAQAPTQLLQKPPPSVAPAPVTNQVTSQPVSADVENLHTKYLDLHKRMKEFWKPFKAECAVKGNPIKGAVGDMRRELRKAMGQITVKREDTRNVIRKIRDIITATRNAGGPTIDIRPFFATQSIPNLSNEADAQYPCILLYAYICFVKFAIKQFEQEAANEDGRIIAELGAIVASLMIDPNFVWNNVPMTDLLLAKFHRVCPILFGIRGNMETKEGQVRLGMLPVGGEAPAVNVYNQRMLGLAAGYAALSLRVVEKPAIPASEYWRALAFLCNTPSASLYGGHFMVIKGLLKDYAKKFITMYGRAGRAMILRATVTLPARAPANVVSTANLVSVLPDSWKMQGLVLQ